MRKRVYVFGPSENTIATCKHLYALGFAPYNPWNDIAVIKKLERRDELFDISKEWLIVSEAVFLTSGFEKTNESMLSEITLAKELGIPIFTHIDNLLKWQREREGMMC